MKSSHVPDCLGGKNVYSEQRIVARADGIPDHVQNGDATKSGMDAEVTASAGSRED